VTDVPAQASTGSEASLTRPIAKFAATVFALLAVWSITMPLFSSPDENAHFVKSAAVVRGVLVGDDLEPTILRSYWSTTVDIDRQFDAANWIPWCFAPMPAEPACDSPLGTTDPRNPTPETTMGRYPPLVYLVPGLATFLGPSDTAVWVARLFVAAFSTMLLTFAYAHLLRMRRPTSALLLAFTPGAVFLAATVSTSGMEIVAAITTWVLLTAALRNELNHRSDRIGLGIALVGLTTARPLGPVLVAIVATLCVVASPAPKRALDILRKHWALATATIVAELAMLGWYVTVYSEHLDSPLVAGQPAQGLVEVSQMALGHVPRLVEQAIGNYGWLDTPTPTPLVWAFLGMVLVAVLRMWGSATVRERATLCSLVAVTVIVSVVLDLNYYRLFRYVGGQGRHLMPLLVGVPLLLLHRWTPTRQTHSVVSWTWAIITAGAGLFALRRYTVGVKDGNFFDMFTAARWSPLLGVTLSAIALVLAPIALAVIMGRNTTPPQAD
jgi:hypothetical protein